MNELSCLIISSTADYATDLICLALEQRSAAYFRINRDQFSQFEILLDVAACELSFSIGDQEYIFRNTCGNAIYYRAPTFLRTYHKTYSLEEQVYHSQWSAFIRNLIVFDRVTWMNNPVNTYRAEQKLYQLSLARRHGLLIPETIVGNTAKVCFQFEDDCLVAKSIDTALFREGNTEMFAYTEIVSRREADGFDLSMAPVCFQENLASKKDIRVTFVAGQSFPFEILKDGAGIEGDWRKTEKHQLEYNPIVLSEKVEAGLSGLMDDLGLAFGGIDLVESDGQLYFIEVNPTGEWSWLQECSGVDLCGPIADFLTHSRR